ncbi:MAG TPA: glucoamylase family protein [Flavitalea sp.]|nr:glucoamylase family protein [Flavitalea sp.]
MKQLSIILLLTCSFLSQCSKKSDGPTPPVTPPATLNIASVNIDGIQNATEYINIKPSTSIKVAFTAPLNTASVPGSIVLTDRDNVVYPLTIGFQNNDSVLIATPSTPLKFLTHYTFTVATTLTSKNNGKLNSNTSIQFFTRIDSTDKFPRISDDSLLTLVQKQTFKYFWDFGHPISGLARERNSSGDVVTSGGSGFGVMAIITGIHRSFITRAEGLARLQKMVTFLKDKAQTFHGAYPHWLNGITGAVIPFSNKDDGADLVETSYLLQGLLTARQYFTGTDPAESAFRNDVNTIWDGVQWNWFRQNNQDILYWHWSPTFNWEMNHPIRGWNEALITYALAASSNTYSIPKSVYDNGWAWGGMIENNNIYYGIQLPLGPSLGGPLFFAHYSFLGINPNQLTDAYADYWKQNKNHTLINYSYSVANPKGYFGYSNSVWGLTASDIRNGYTASSPTNDVGVIAPTAALSSFPYTPLESMRALKFYYYVLGDKLWKEYGFVDAFSLSDEWYANSFLAIDQGPIIIMIENYRSGLLWNLFMSAPEIKRGLRNLGFQSPNI